MKKILTLFCCCFIYAIANAGVAIDWFRTNTGTGQAVACDSLNNVYTASSNGVIVLNKRDKFSNLLWEVTYTTNVQFNYETPTGVHVDPQGNVIVVGFRYTNSIENGNHANALLVNKYTSGGSLVWNIIIDGDFSAFFDERYHNNVTSQMDANGNVYVASGGNVSGGIEGFNTIKVSPSGAIVWIRAQSFGGTYHLVWQIRLNKNRLGLAGFSSIFTGKNALLWVLDTSGVTKWTKEKKWKLWPGRCFR